MFRILHRATFAQAPEGTNFEVGVEVIVETTYDSETYRSSMRIVGSAVPKEQTPSPDAFVRTRMSDETDGAIRIDLPALRAAMKTIEVHAGLVDECFKANKPYDTSASKAFLDTLRLIVEDEWRPQNEPKRRSP